MAVESLTLEPLFAAAPEAMLVVDRGGTIRLANRRAEELFRYAPQALLGRSVDTLVPAALMRGHAHNRARYETDPQPRPMGEHLDLRGRRADGSELPIDVALGPAEVAGERFVVAIVRDVTGRKQQQDELRYLSEHDALTGLLNRRGLDQRIGQALAQGRRHAVDAALVLLDLDGFKLVNDRLGHLEGDRLLREIAQGLRERVRAGDTIARLGGDEFAVLTQYADAAAAAVLARDLLGVVRDRARGVTEGRIAVSASIGVASLGAASRDPISTIAAADEAMYEAKRAGGDTVRLAPGVAPAPTPARARAHARERRPS